MNTQSISISSAYHEIGDVCAQIVELVSDTLEPDKVIELQIALSEALNNVIEHSYEEQAGRPVAVECKVESSYVSIRIEDEGKGMPADPVDAGDASRDISLEEFDALPEGGMGLQLIEGCVDEVHYGRCGKRNVLCLKKFK